MHSVVSLIDHVFALSGCGANVLRSAALLSSICHAPLYSILNAARGATFRVDDDRPAGPLRQQRRNLEKRKGQISLKMALSLSFPLFLYSFFLSAGTSLTLSDSIHPSTLLALRFSLTRADRMHRRTDGFILFGVALPPSVQTEGILG